MEPFLFGTAAFVVLLVALPLTVRLEARGEPFGPLSVRVLLPPRRRPFVWEGSLPDLLLGAEAGGGRKGPRRPGPGALLEFWRRLRRAALPLYRAVVLRQWELHLRIGGREAALTALFAAAGWAWQATLRQSLATGVHLAAEPRLSVWPAFADDGCAFRLSCALEVRGLYLVLTGLRLSLATLKLLRQARAA